MKTPINSETLPLIQARFPSKCSITGLPIYKGDKIFYNPENKSVIKAIKIFDCEDYSQHLKTDAFLFKISEQLFWLFMDANGDRNELNEMYFSEDAIYDKKFAIQGQVEDWFEQIREEEVKFAWLHKLEFNEQFAA